MASGLLYGCVAPHPPVLLPEVGAEMAKPVRPTVEALEEVGRHIASYEPETLVLMSPHGQLLPDRMAIGLAPEARGDFSNFGAAQVQVRVPCDTELAAAIREAAERVVIHVAPVDGLTGPESEGGYYRLDHGAAVPLHFLLPFLPDVKVVLLGFSYLPRSTHLSFGERIRQACDASGRRVVFVASGDLSHRLIPTAPAGYDPLGKVFDESIVSALEKSDWDSIIGLPEELVDRAGVCGYLSILTLIGALRKDVSASRVLSYQGPYGVGYAVAECELKLRVGAGAGSAASASSGSTGSEGRPSGERSSGRASGDEGLGGAAIRADPPEAQAAGDDSGTRAWGGQTAADFAVQDLQAFLFPESDFSGQVLALARAALEYFVRTGQRLALPAALPEGFHDRRACFVTLRQLGSLRGCVGTILPTHPTLAHEIVENAIGAAARDHRFAPVQGAELERLIYSVDVLTTPEPVTSRDMLDPARYGMIVVQEARVGVLLPGIEQITEVEQQFQICCQKAGITRQDGIEIHRFEVNRYGEPGAEH